MKKLMVILIGLCVLSCTSKPGSGEDNEASSSDSMRKEQYMVAGETLYLQYCSNCHQQDGSGLAELWPPLKDSDYMAGNVDRVLCIIKNGLQGEIEVNGKTYNQIMPPLNMLTDLEVAEIATYAYNSFGHNEGLIPVTRVTAALKECETN